MIKMELVQLERISGKVPYCIEDIIATVAKSLNMDYELMFLQTWDFVFDGSDRSDYYPMGERIELSRFNSFALLNEYHGIELIRKDIQDIHELISVIESELARSFPVAIHFDCYYCPWDDYYNTYHNEHMCLAVGIDKQKNKLLLTDPYHMVADQWIDMDVVAKACRYYCTFQISGPKKQEYNYLELLQNTILNITDKNKASNPIANIRLFAKLVAEQFDPEKEFANVRDYFSSKIFARLINVIKSRGMFYILLKFIAEREKLPELLALADNFKVMTSLWNGINSLFTKSYYASYFKASERIAKKILEAADYEEATAYKLLEAIGKKSTFDSCGSAQNDCNENQKSIVSLDLDTYFNNKGFGDEKSHSKANLTGMGEFLLDENTPSGNRVSIDNFLFQFPSIQEEKYDNISCMSQFIPVDPACYRSLLFLGCSEYGNYYVVAKVHYTDGFKEEIKIGLSDLAYTPAYGEQIFWRGKSVRYCDGAITVQQQNAKLYAISIPLQHDGSICGIELPDCPNMHIFAISLSV